MIVGWHLDVMMNRSTKNRFECTQTECKSTTNAKRTKTLLLVVEGLKVPGQMGFGTGSNSKSLRMSKISHNWWGKSSNSIIATWRTIRNYNVMAQANKIITDHQQRGKQQQQQQQQKTLLLLRLFTCIYSIPIMYTYSTYSCSLFLAIYAIAHEANISCYTFHHRVPQTIDFVFHSIIYNELWTNPTTPMYCMRVENKVM